MQKHGKILTALFLCLLGVATAWPAPAGGAKGQKGGKARRSNPGRETRMEIVTKADIMGAEDNGPAVGSDAPDFSLMPLKFYDFKVEQKIASQEAAARLYEPVKLSDFRGIKPVVLIFGSYT